MLPPTSVVQKQKQTKTSHNNKPIQKQNNTKTNTPFQQQLQPTSDAQKTKTNQNKPQQNNQSKTQTKNQHTFPARSAPTSAGALL